MKLYEILANAETALVYLVSRMFATEKIKVD